MTIEEIRSATRLVATPLGEKPARNALSEGLRLLRHGGAALALWLAAIILLTAFLEPVRTVAVFGSEHRVLAALAGTDVRIISAGRGYLVVRGDEKGFVRRLYAQGALLVLPSRPSGCIRSGAMS